ncbi:T9SS type A sorting domain-containing protein [candidate division WOR-3 bacterium]|nr:T9SS type A sorting domain-containing protein [candidate division WOR-3 bacterium]
MTEWSVSHSSWEWIDDSLYRSFYRLTDVYHGSQIIVERSGFSWSQDINGDFILFVNKFINTSRASYDSVYTGLWYDFDIPSTDYMNDSAGYIQTVNLCYMSDAAGYSQKIGICFLQPSAPHGANWFNYATTPGDDNAYFSALQNTSVATAWPSAPSDYKIMINCGPNALGAGETLTIVYGVVAGNDESELTAAVTRMSFVYDSLSLFIEEQPIAENTLRHLYIPGKFFTGDFSARLTVGQDEPVEVKVFDIQGRTVLDLGLIQAKKGENQISVNAGNLCAGQYFLRVTSSTFDWTERFGILE